MPQEPIPPLPARNRQRGEYFFHGNRIRYEYAHPQFVVNAAGVVVPAVPVNIQAQQVGVAGIGAPPPAEAAQQPQPVNPRWRGDDPEVVWFDDPPRRDAPQGPHPEWYGWVPVDHATWTPRAGDVVCIDSQDPQGVGNTSLENFMVGYKRGYVITEATAQLGPDSLPMLSPQGIFREKARARVWRRGPPKPNPFFSRPLPLP
jgi:hypothetical protein